MFPIAVLLGGACIGVVLGSTRVPRVRALPLVSGLLLLALVAATVFIVEPANLLLAIAFVLTTVVSSALYAAWLWSRELPNSPHGYGWYFLNELLRPNEVRRHYLLSMNETAASENEKAPTFVG